MEDEELFEADRSDPEFIFKQLSLDVRGKLAKALDLK